VAQPARFRVSFLFLDKKNRIHVALCIVDPC